MSDYPEHEKLRAIQDQSQSCGEFMDWLIEQGVVLAKYHFHTDECHTESSRRPSCGMSAEMLYPVHTSTESLLAKFFDIDLNKIELEKRAMLESIRHNG